MTSKFFPFDEYVDRVLDDSKLLFGLSVVCWNDVEEPDWEDARTSITKRKLRKMLLDAWIDGLKHSLVLIGEK